MSSEVHSLKVLPAAKRPLVAFYFDEQGQVRTQEDNLSAVQLLALKSFAEHYFNARAAEETQKMMASQVRPPRTLAA